MRRLTSGIFNSSPLLDTTTAAISALIDLHFTPNIIYSAHHRHRHHNEINGTTYYIMQLLNGNRIIKTCKKFFNLKLLSKKKQNIKYIFTIQTLNSSNGGLI